MDSAAHSRNVSSDSTSSTGSAYHFILEHILSYPGTYEPRGSNELPLRSMYSLNSAAPALSGASAFNTPSHSINNSPIISGFPTMQQSNPLAMHDNRVAAAVFKSNILDQIAQLPQQPASLPPAFVTSFLERCFPMQLEFVDFPQSLTALDYLKDLEMRRRKELAYALQRHGIDKTVLETSQDAKDLAKWYPAVAEWVRTLEQKEKKADKLYTQLYVALRRWILINEMALLPFNKHNCHAMLNTLYPPVEVTQPSSKLTIPLLMVQREGFFNYVKAVEARGPMCLQTLMKQGARPGEDNGWPAVKRTLNNYLKLANQMIHESQEIGILDIYINSTPEVPSVIEEEFEGFNDNSRKTDSGVSFSNSSDGKHSKHPSTSSSKSSGTTSSNTSRTTSSSFEFSRGSTLERLARELKKMKPRRLQVDEIIKPSSPSSASPHSSFPSVPVEKENTSPVSPNKSAFRIANLRKMKSLGTIGELKHGNDSATSLRNDGNGDGSMNSPSSPLVPFDGEALRNKRRPFVNMAMR